MEYQKKVLENALILAEEFKKIGFNLVGNSTQNHLVLLDLRNKKVDGGRLETVLNEINIYGNKNTIPGDLSALLPSGFR